ncbi:MAG UNVERIFIED_CONTAM: hypothetical protein LVR18_20165 [Planctomycetaceae bacterium]
MKGGLVTNGEQNIDYSVVAAYMPCAFCMELRDPVFEKPAQGPGIPEFTDSTLPYFIHESAHLVQDRATFRGISEFLEMWDQVDAVRNHLKGCGGKINLPLLDPKSGKSRLASEGQWAVMMELMQREREPRGKWDGEGQFWAFDAHSIAEQKAMWNNQEVTLRSVTVEFRDNHSLETYQHSFGAWEIKEAYSVAVGMLHGGRLPALGSTGFEYLAAERILTHSFGSVSPLQVVAICHWSLHSLTPGATFFDLIELFQQDGKLPDAYTLYDVARREFMSRGFCELCESLLKNVELYAAELGKVGPAVASLFSWYLEHARRLIAIQFDMGRRFPLDTFLCHDTSENKGIDKESGLQSLFAEVEVPLIIWPDGELYAISMDREEAGRNTVLNRAMCDLLARLWVNPAGSWRCPLYSGCSLGLREENDCLSRPWRMARHLETCPYGFAAKILRLEPDADFTVSPITDSGARFDSEGYCWMWCELAISVVAIDCVSKRFTFVNSIGSG